MLRVLAIIIAGLTLGTLLFAVADGSGLIYVVAGVVFAGTTLLALALALRGL